MDDNSIRHIPVIKVSDVESRNTSDMIAIEEPLEIRLRYTAGGEQITKNVSVTMRTPGNDVELATGFLFTEGIIHNSSDITASGHIYTGRNEDKHNTVEVELKPGIIPNLQNAERNFYTTSSCGICGKGSIDAIHTVSPYRQQKNHHSIEAEILYGLPEVLRYHQTAFASTGGIHASALFSRKGELIMIREDVGRHNALDKLIGAAFKENMLPLTDSILLLSGRASFELVQKAVMAGICTIAAVGAPSSLAVELAESSKITRIILPSNEVTY
jgi:FdhD protein